jgi:hypothetical protein
LRDRRVQFAHDRVGHRRRAQAAAEEIQRLGDLAHLAVGQAQVKQRERMVRLLPVLHVQQAQVALLLLRLQLRVLVADMVHHHVGPARGRARAPQRRQDLLVDAVLPG